MRDGDLRQKFMKYLPEVFFQSVETWSTGQGVPDSHYIFPNGAAGWIEHKRTAAWFVHIEKEQSAWLERYARHGGRCFVAVRRVTTAGPRKGQAVDELYMFRGVDARQLMLRGLRNGPAPTLFYKGGAAQWDWDMIRSVLIGDNRIEW